MSLAPISVPERKASPHLSVNLGSNNPFRNRALSPSSPVSPGPASPGLASPAIRPERPRSTNPFLDDTEILSPQSAPAGTVKSPMSEKSNPYIGNAAEIFESLSLDSKPADPPPKDTKPRERRPPPPRPDKPYSSSSSRPRPSGRPEGPPRPDRSRDRSGSKERSREKEDPFDIFADPTDRKEHRPSRPREGRPRPRRNSESSIMEKPRRMDSEEDRRRRERRHRDGKPRPKKPTGYRLDLIDKLDVTSIYGTGLFHHDGPFDACNPHRNRKGSRQAPMQAFPKDSKNMAIGGAGPNNSDLDLALIHGHTTESYLDYNSGISKKAAATAFDSSTRVEPIHGAESMGLGTSTFLEGAPASRSAIQRRQSETENQPSQNGGLQRKKSLAQKIRGINRPTTGRMISPEPQKSPSSADATTSNRTNEKNPFFQDYDDGYESKGARNEGNNLSTRVRASSSPKRGVGLQRETTNGSTGGDELKPNGGGFMNRMKSLRRPRPERRMPSE